MRALLGLENMDEDGKLPHCVTEACFKLSGHDFAGKVLMYGDEGFGP